MDERDPVGRTNCNSAGFASRDVRDGRVFRASGAARRRPHRRGSEILAELQRLANRKVRDVLRGRARPCRLGQNDAAIAWLNKAFDERRIGSFGSASIRAGKGCAPIHDLPSSSVMQFPLVSLSIPKLALSLPRVVRGLGEYPAASGLVRGRCALVFCTATVRHPPSSLLHAVPIPVRTLSSVAVDMNAKHPDKKELPALHDLRHRTSVVLTSGFTTHTSACV